MMMMMVLLMIVVMMIVMEMKNERNAKGGSGPGDGLSRLSPTGRTPDAIDEGAAGGA